MNSSVKKYVAPGFILGATLIGLVPLFWFAVGHSAGFALSAQPDLLNILVFTLKQAFLSAALSILGGIFIARAFARRQFCGRTLLLNLFALPLALPAIVVVLAISSIYGTQGLLHGWFNIYGMNGILLAHVFFNLPLATRLLLGALNTIPQENFRLAEGLGFTDTAILRHVEWPVLRNAMPQVFGLIFLLCAASFVIVLSFGGPSATTLEVAIYQSLRQDFDAARAVALAAVQITLCAILVFLAGKGALSHQVRQSHHQTIVRRDGTSVQNKLIDAFAILASILCVLPPMTALLISGLSYVSLNFSALATSVSIAIPSALLCAALSWPLARAGQNVFALAAFIVPPAVMATGWFLAFRHISDSFLFIFLSIVMLNALMALPFAYAALRPAFSKMNRQHEQLCAELGLIGLARFWHIDFPMTRNAVVQALLMAFILSLGDLTAVTLLGSQGLVTLPSLIHLQMGHYRGNEAAGSALVLAALCYGLTLLSQRIGRTP